MCFWYVSGMILHSNKYCYLYFEHKKSRSFSSCASAVCDQWPGSWENCLFLRAWGWGIDCQVRKK